MRVVSICSGVGLLDLGLEWAGMRTVQLCEIDPWRRLILALRYPGVPIHPDLRTVEPAECDVVAAGFPCPPTSRAGKRRAQRDERWVWPWVADAVRRARPRYVIVENPPGLLDGHGAFGDVLGSLAALGLDAQWTCFRASDLGAPHERDRLWLVAAHPEQVDVWEQSGGLFGPGWAEAALAGLPRPDGVPAADPRAKRRDEGTREAWESWWRGLVGDNPHPFGAHGPWERVRLPLPVVRRMDDGQSPRLDASVRRRRCEALGDAVVPQCAQLVGLRILQLDRDRGEMRRGR